MKNYYLAEFQSNLQMFNNELVRVLFSNLKSYLSRFKQLIFFIVLRVNSVIVFKKIFSKTPTLYILSANFSWSETVSLLDYFISRPHKLHLKMLDYDDFFILKNRTKVLNVPLSLKCCTIFLNKECTIFYGILIYVIMKTKQLIGTENSKSHVYQILQFFLEKLNFQLSFVYIFESNKAAR